MFERSQRFYDAIYAWKDYPAEVDKLERLIEDDHPVTRTLLDVACGTGKHLALLRERYQVEGVDVDPKMVAIARGRLGGVPVHVGDMTTFDLGRTFDVVTCLFSSIAYARTEDGLQRAVANLARHAEPGGLVIVEPFFTLDSWESGRIWALFVDEPDLKIARMDIAAEPVDAQVTLMFQYLVGTDEGIEHFTETHPIGLFTMEQQMNAFRATGLDVHHDPEGLMGRGLYVGRVPV
jgi:SAM-dependent methyltransferase